MPNRGITGPEKASSSAFGGVLDGGLWCNGQVEWTTQYDICQAVEAKVEDGQSNMNICLVKLARDLTGP